MTERRDLSDRGFSLLEILVVLSVLAVLATIILTIHGSAVRSGRAIGCVHNLRNVYQATLGFIQDHNGKIPPPLGPIEEVDTDFFYPAYWWNQAYLGRYAVGPLNRLQDSRGMFSQEEVEVYNCPARFADGPDINYTHPNGNPSISYVMAHVPYRIERFLFANIENPAQTLYLTEGRQGVVRLSAAYTGELGSKDTRKRYRRFHNDSLNLLFYDGHIQSFSGEDQEIHPYMPESH